MEYMNINKGVKCVHTLNNAILSFVLFIHFYFSSFSFSLVSHWVFSCSLCRLPLPWSFHSSGSRRRRSDFSAGSERVSKQCESARARACVCCLALFFSASRLVSPPICFYFLCVPLRPILHRNRSAQPHSIYRFRFFFLSLYSRARVAFVFQKKGIFLSRMWYGRRVAPHAWFLRLSCMDVHRIMFPFNILPALSISPCVCECFFFLRLECVSCVT